ncbi:MAG TPA: endonuclease/exonuclease/phosphatase family protein [Longimicrobiaceae bacterium]|nr:endonuclease/exonuclease/phosphatase family protein [Longimicrobiaceae bacterium]
MRPAAACLLALLALAGCKSGENYLRPDGPRYAAPVPAPAPRSNGDTLRIASFNVEYALRVDSAIVVLTTDPELRRADVVLLQEMDAPGTARIARALSMGYVYYPAALRKNTGRDFGNAVLSRWPIVEDSKILLPHPGLFGQVRRIATGVTLDVAGTQVRVYSTHLGTMVNATPGARNAQLRTVMADAAKYPRVIIGGDMNSHGVGGAAIRGGYAWPTEHGPKTTKFGRWDHIFVRGLTVPATGAAGTVLNGHGTSDHIPVWAVALLR